MATSRFFTPMDLSPLSVFGLFTVFYVLAKIFQRIRIYVRPSRLGRYLHPSPNGEPPWAVVTGATDGIGRAFAHELASFGFNVVIHGRNPEKLSQELRQLRDAFPQRSFRSFTADAATVACVNCLETASQHGHERLDGSTVDFAAIQRTLDDINLTVLVNNVGGGSKTPVYQSIKESSEARIASTVSLNALFPLHLTRVLLPNLLRNSPALVINISSMADMGLPMIASYAASKSFLMSLTRSLSLEIGFESQGNDIEILGIRVGEVTATSHLRDPPRLFCPSAEVMAKAALSRAGHGLGIVTGYWGHALQELAKDLMPAPLGDKVSRQVIWERMKREMKNS